MLLEPEIARPLEFFTNATGAPRVLSAEQVAFYHEHGYLHIPAVFTQQETDRMLKQNPAKFLGLE